ncbi:MAG: prenyltransferase/squalene oxidase repeat-containing protein [Dehalococcoidia bacterium]
MALGEDPRDFGGVDLLAALEGGFEAGSGRFGIDLFDHGLFMLARASAGLEVPDAAVSYLTSKQLDDGGWEFDEGWGADTNTTALAIQALIAAGEDPSSAAAQGGLAYLAAAQNDDGGFPYSPESEYGTDSDANSTAVVIQALAAAGEDIGAGGPWDKGEGRTPLAALLSFQNAETGAFTFGGQDSAFATYQAVPGLLLAPLPVATTTLEERVVPAPSATPGVAVVTIPAAGQGPGEGRQGAALPLATALAAGGLLAAGSGLLLRLRRG